MTKLLSFFCFLLTLSCHNTNTAQTENNMITDKNTIPSLNYYLTVSLDLDISKLMTRDFSNAYPWLDDPDLFCAFDLKADKAYVVYREAESDWIQLNKKANHEKLFQLMTPAVSQCDFNSKTELRQFLEALYQLSDDPRKEILDDILLRRKNSIMFSYLKKEGKTELELKETCMPIKVRKERDEFIIDFNLLNSDGSVTKWIVNVGNTVKSIDVAQLYEPNSFYFPNEY